MPRTTWLKIGLAGGLIIGISLRHYLTDPSNLVANAIQASSKDGEVLVKTRRSDAEALLEVTDQGYGISEEDREKIFQPFFSTKKQGTGLGLANVKRIVEAQGGKVAFHANKNKGTTFVITVPLDRQKQ